VNLSIKQKMQSLHHKYKNEKTAYSLLIIPILWWGVFFLFAFVRSIYFSFTDLRFSVDNITSFNLDNYIRLFHDAAFGMALGNTMIWTIVMTIFNNLIGLILAFLIFRMKKGKKLFLALLFWPTLVSAVAGAQVTKLLFNPSDTGVINSIIIALGGNPLGWYNDPNIALLTLMIVPTFLGFSTQMMIYYVALIGIPKSYSEYASLDTSSSRKVLMKVYLPLIKNAINFNILLSIIGNIKVIGAMQLVSEGGLGGPLNSTLSIMLYLYNKGITGYEMGYACTIGVVTMIIILLLSGVQMKLKGKDAVDYE